MSGRDEKELLNHFQEAVGSGRIRAWFQPVCRSMTGRFIGMEALARWFDPEGNMLSPADFIPQLERSGLIMELDLEILRQACLFYREMEERGTPVQAISVNLSRQDFNREDLFEKVNGLLEELAVPHSAMKLEITESLMLENAERFEKIFHRFVDAGYSVWLDDFGSGYSSLNVLQNYSFDVIKFDMLFLRNMTLKGRELLMSLIGMAKTLGIHTLTEGVETEEQRLLLRDAGCEAQQGFYYSKPLPKEGIIALTDARPDLLEKPEDKSYWDQVGRLNFLSPNPLKDFTDRRSGAFSAGRISSHDGSIALVECGKDSFDYVYATEGYRERLRELGFSSVDSLEKALSNQRSHMFLLFRKAVLEALRDQQIKTVEYVYKDVYFRLSTLAVARKPGRAMVAMRLNTFDSEREVKTAQAMLNYSSALMTTYELVVLLYMNSRVSNRIYTSMNLPVYDQEQSMEESLRKFCEAEVEPVDQKRYLQFLDFATLQERVDASPGKLIQNIFRMRWEKDSGNWYTARITPFPSAAEEKIYILTIQSIQGNVRQWLDLAAKEHPELL